MAYNTRTLSPGGRRIQNAGRTSDSRVNEEEYRSRYKSNVSPRGSAGVIPISSETFVNYPPPSSTTRLDPRYDSYSGRSVDSYSSRPRGSSFVEVPRTSAASTIQASSRGRPTVIQNEYARQTSPQKREYHVTTAASKEPPRKETTRKVYSVNDGTANLVADVNLSSGAGRDRHHQRRESGGYERSGNKGIPLEKDRGRKAYHLNGAARGRENSVVDDDSFSYTDAAGMFKETEPRWREREARPRRNSIDRAGGGSRERPVSMLDPAIDPRRPTRDPGPPVSTRGWDKIKNVLTRSGSQRDKRTQSPPTRAKEQYSPIEARLPQSPVRGRYADTRGFADAYYVAPRVPSKDRYTTAGTAHPDRHDQFEFREPRPHERRNSMTRLPDRSVERRGFGIRGDSQDRHGRGSDESFTRDNNNHRDSGYANLISSVDPPHRRDTAPETTYHEHEKRDRQRADDRDYPRERDKEARRRDDAYARDDDYERDRRKERERDSDYEVDKQRERERERMLQPHAERDRHHHRRDSYRDNRNAGYDRKDTAPPGGRDSGDSLGPSAAVAGGVAAGAAAAYGLTNHNKNHNDDHAREQRTRVREPSVDKSNQDDRARAAPKGSQDSKSEEGAGSLKRERERERDRDRHRPADDERGLGFAFEQDHPDPSAPRPVAVGDPTERDFERTHDDRAYAEPSRPPAVDADEEYKRRLEQVQRELGHNSDDYPTDSDADRERRRREREARQRDRDREHRTGDGSYSSDASYAQHHHHQQPPTSADSSFDNNSVDGSVSTVRPGLHRKPSILDAPMAANDAGAQIIDNSLSEKRENRVRIVDPPAGEGEDDSRRPRGILKKPTEKFPEHPNQVREGVAPLKDASKSGIPPGARWTKIDRRLVNPEALEEAKERFEERLDFVIVLRVLTKAEIQKLADRTKELRDERYEDERSERRAAAARRRERRARDEYEDEDSEDEFKPRAPKLLEAPSSSSAAAAGAAPSASSSAAYGAGGNGEAFAPASSASVASNTAANAAAVNGVGD
ncbi:hypothetical protein BDY17DRAFT_324962 [Neohortaea acidophila]|uniref:DUF8035 domain-containing protein n=1 Tax=Neohortaea acidophila TaxID=245834 RepID=A0A6A6PS38_9PEZI|nr:uncharacterized protein BDY17DRAFT_324962 [Neohortaea acidophila]KAF2482695.1 hypothetical protein BDY17DRAFT_324962 [Neohortaea acidophila]